MSFDIKEDRYAEEEVQAGRDCREASPGRRPGLSGPEHRGRHPPDRRERVTYYRWRQEYGGLKTDQIRRLKELEQENSRLRRAVSDLTLDKLILQEAARGNF